MPEKYELKPKKKAFVTFRFVKGAIYSLIFLGFLGIGLQIFIDFGLLPAIILFFLYNVIRFFSLKVAFKKRKYSFYYDKIEQLGGRIFSDNETELVLKNITHVQMILPYIENKLLGTGSIIIQSAGSSASAIVLQNIANPEGYYDYVKNLMKNAGFSLNADKLVQKEEPSIIGIVFEMVRNFVAGLFFFIVFGGMGLISVAASLGAGEAIYLGTALVLIAAYLGLKTFMSFMDKKRRVYSLYSDVIMYSEGFLTKNYSFIPMENLSDSSTNQNLFDRILNLHDITLSCAGSGQEIKFTNMEHGKDFETNVDKLIGEGKKNHEKQEVKKEEQPFSEKRASSHKPAANISSPERDREFTATYKMNMKRTLAENLLVPFIFIIIFAPLWILLPPFLPIFILVIALMSIPTIIKAATTTYNIKNETMQEIQDFVSKKTKEFSNDKVMAVLFKENPFDRWMNTLNINFWSIGSSDDIKFQCIDKTESLKKKIISKSGIRPQKKMYEINPKFKFSEMLRAWLPVTITAIIITIASLITGIIIHPVLLSPLAALIIIYSLTGFVLSRRYKHTKLDFYKDYICFRQGWLFRKEYYVLYDNVKDITTTRYPFSERGSLKFNIAGERVIKTDKNKTIVSNNFQTGFVNNIKEKDELIDLIFYKRPGRKEIISFEKELESMDPERLIVAKPSLKNSVVPLVIISVIIFPLIVLLPITLTFTIWSLKKKSYMIESYRVLERSGILYRRQTSIVFTKIDYINQDRKMLNKMFGNGNIIINTAGSSTAEITIKNIPNYQEFYKKLKKTY